MIRVLVTHLERDFGANIVFIFANQSRVLKLYIFWCVHLDSYSKSDFWLDLILQFGVRAWYSNLGFNNLQIHHKNLIFI
ncbi:hypothetical protein HanIR_Chr04g0164061 [Helianthus annuus]|nr:hypothetical protein HanIR_Chr04g0164061 [Helianthus annuus]